MLKFSHEYYFSQQQAELTLSTHKQMMISRFGRDLFRLFSKAPSALSESFLVENEP